MYACPCACITSELENLKFVMYNDDGGMVLCKHGTSGGYEFH